MGILRLCEYIQMQCVLNYNVISCVWVRVCLDIYVRVCVTMCMGIFENARACMCKYVYGYVCPCMCKCV